MRRRGKAVVPQEQVDGKDGEVLLGDRSATVRQSVGNEPGWDIEYSNGNIGQHWFATLINSEDSYVEAKSARVGPIMKWTNERGEHTLLVETECWSNRAMKFEKSAIYASTSDWYVWALRDDNNNVVGGSIVSVDRMRALVESGHYALRTINTPGARNMGRGYAIPIDHLIGLGGNHE